jgi:hypothetical protein
MAHDLTRKEALASVLLLPALAAALTLGMTAVARADSRTQLKYQSKPLGGKKCSGCALFTSGKNATANGTCTVITGPISPHGWCTAYTPKS